MLRSEVTLSLPCSLSHSEKLNWDSQQGRDLAMSGRNKQKFQLGQSYSYIRRKVWYHQIWIQNDLGFMVLILMCIYESSYSVVLFLSYRVRSDLRIFFNTRFDQLSWFCILKFWFLTMYSFDLPPVYGQIVKNQIFKIKNLSE